MVAKWFNATHHKINSKGKKQYGPIIITPKTHTGKSIVGKPKFNVRPRKTMNKIVIYYPVVIIPKKPVV